MYFIGCVLISLLVIIWELIKVTSIILFYSLYFFFFFFIFWSVYKLIALSLIEILGVFPLVLFNALIFLFFVSFKTETRKVYYNYVSAHEANLEFPIWQGIKPYDYGYRVYCSKEQWDGKFYKTVEYTIWDQIKFNGVSLSDWIVVVLVSFLTLLLIILPLLALGFLTFYFLLVTLVSIFASITLYLLNFIPSIDLDLVVFSAQFVFTTSPDSQTKSKSKSKSKPEESAFVSNKFKIFNGLELPGILFHFDKFPATLLNHFENSLNSTPNVLSIN